MRYLKTQGDVCDPRAARRAEDPDPLPSHRGGGTAVPRPWGRGRLAGRGGGSRRFLQGAVYANFTGKEDLLLAVWREHFAAKRTRLADAVAGADDAAAVLGAIHAAMTAFFAAGPWALLQAEVRRRSADWPFWRPSSRRWRLRSSPR